nr:hypothetical protein [uncultured archaeon]
MKITKIEREKWVYLVTFEPNFLEKFFGIKTKTKKFKDSGNHYTFGGGNIYHDEDGEKTGNGSYVGESIDKWRRKF